MNWFNGLKIKAKLGMSFCIVALITAIAGYIGDIGINNAAVSTAATSGAEIIKVAAITVMDLIIAIGFGILITRSITKPINVASGYIARIAKGEIPEKISDYNNGDFNEMTKDINHLIDSMEQITYVVEEITKGNLLVTAKPRSAEDKLMTVLGEMIRELTAVVKSVNDTAGSVTNGSME